MYHKKAITSQSYVKRVTDVICANYGVYVLVLKNEKKFFAISALLLTLIIAAPIAVSLLFNKTVINNGKIIINKQVDAPFLSGVKKDTIVLFFGYVGCVNVCAPILSRLNAIYSSPKIKDARSSSVVVFVNLTPEIAPGMPQIFVDGFNKEFIGVHLNKRQLLSIEREFALFYSDGIADKENLTHSDFIYLIKREKGKFVLKNAYTTHPLNHEALIDDIKSAR